MMTKYVFLVILLAIGLSGSYLIKGGLYLAGIEPSATMAYWILGSVCFASILYLLYSIKRVERGRSDASLVAEPCIGFLVLLLCCNAWGLAFRETIPARQPALFAGGGLDPLTAMNRQSFDALEQTMAGLKEKVLLPGAGHWIQQERPSEINRLLIDFLNGLEK
jgi:pimeloyl-ACP methyl ester carboxylesterase